MAYLPKNQNKCWYNIGSPPPAGSKKVVLKFLSVNNIVNAPANTGNDNNNKKAVISTAHTNKGILCNVIPGALMLNIVQIKLIAPNNDDIPAKCKLKIPKSTAPPECAIIEDNGGYTVQPVPTPDSTNADAKIKINEGNNNQNDMLFNLGNRWITYLRKSLNNQT